MAILHEVLRAIRGVASPFGGRLRLGSAAVALLFLVAAALSACGDDDGDGDGDGDRDDVTPASSPSSVAATTTPIAGTPTGVAGEGIPETGTADGFRAFARRIDAAVEAGDSSFFSDRLKTQHVACDETNTPPQLGDPACEFVGQEFEGFQVGAWRSEGAIVPAERLPEAFDRVYDAALPADADAFGDGTPSVYAISPNGTTGEAAVTALVERPPEFAGEGPLRAALSTSWVFEDGRWLMDRVIIAYVLAEDFLEPSQEGRSYYPNWERF